MPESWKNAGKIAADMGSGMSPATPNAPAMFAPAYCDASRL
jgi:hypothetical protein